MELHEDMVDEIVITLMNARVQLKADFLKNQEAAYVLLEKHGAELYTLYLNRLTEEHLSIRSEIDARIDIRLTELKNQTNQ